MKKSTSFLGAIILAAVAGALGAGYLYLLKREKELDEYEQLLFSEEFSDDCDCASCDSDCCCEEEIEADGDVQVLDF